MISPERLRDLEFIADLWLKGMKRAKKQFDELIRLRQSGHIHAPDDVEFLNRRIEAEDHAISEYLKAHTLANSLVDRAKSGEDI